MFQKSMYSNENTDAALKENISKLSYSDFCRESQKVMFEPVEPVSPVLQKLMEDCPEENTNDKFELLRRLNSKVISRILNFKDFFIFK